jgi:hypothetical protein
MEIVDDDPIEIVAKRARKAFIRIGKVDEFEAGTFLKGRVGIEGHTARLTVHWQLDKASRVRLDISSRSDDELSRAADQAMYRFLDSYKLVRPEDLDKPDPKIGKRATVFTIIALLVIGYVAYRLLVAPWPH